MISVLVNKTVNDLLGSEILSVGNEGSSTQ